MDSAAQCVMISGSILRQNSTCRIVYMSGLGVKVVMISHQNQQQPVSTAGADRVQKGSFLLVKVSL